MIKRDSDKFYPLQHTGYSFAQILYVMLKLEIKQSETLSSIRIVIWTKSQKELEP